jgi:hypothetical protein
MVPSGLEGGLEGDGREAVDWKLQLSVGAG